MPLKQRKQIFQINITWLKIPTGRRQTSWLFTKCDGGFELGTTEKQIPLVIGRPWTWDLRISTPAPNQFRINEQTLTNLFNTKLLQFVITDCLYFCGNDRWNFFIIFVFCNIFFFTPVSCITARLLRLKRTLSCRSQWPMEGCKYKEATKNHLIPIHNC